MKIRLNQNLHGHKKGEVINLDLCNINDQRYWRKAIKDSKIDKSVSVIEGEKEKSDAKNDSQDSSEEKSQSVNNKKNNKKS